MLITTKVQTLFIVIKKKPWLLLQNTFTAIPDDFMIDNEKFDNDVVKMSIMFLLFPFRCCQSIFLFHFGDFFLFLHIICFLESLEKINILWCKWWIAILIRLAFIFVIFEELKKCGKSYYNIKNYTLSVIPNLQQICTKNITNI